MFHEKDYQNVLATLRIKEKAIIKRDFQRGLFTLEGKQGEKEVLLKVVAKNQKEKVRQLKKEIDVSRIFKDRLEWFKEIAVIERGRIGAFFYLIRKYARGASLGFPYNLDKRLNAVDRYSFIQEHYLKRYRSIIKQIALLIKSLQAVKTDWLKDLSSKDLFSHHYPLDIKKRVKSYLEEKLVVDLESSFNFYQRIKKDYKLLQFWKPSMGDLTPANIVFTKEGKILLIDFGFFSLDNPMLDVASFWLFLWRYPSWQREWLRYFIENKKDKDYFRASVIRIITYLYYQELITATKQNCLPLLINRFKEHPWTFYLINSGKSFSQLTKKSFKVPPSMLR